MAKFKLGRLRQLHAEIGSILSEYDTAKASEAEDNAGNVASSKEIEKRDQPGAQDSALAGVRALENIPGYDRLRKNAVAPLPPTQISQDYFFKPAK